MENKKRGMLITVILIGILVIAGIFAISKSSVSNDNKEKDTTDTSKEVLSTENEESESSSEVQDNKENPDTDGEEEQAKSTEEQKQDLISGDDAKELVQTNNDAYEDGDIKCSNFSRYTGQYVEDGKDELVENVAAILVTNNSDQYLEFATIEYEIAGKEAVFVVTGLPAGKSAWIMEKSRLMIGENAKFTYKGCADSFRDDVVNSTDKINISTSGNMMTVKNNADKTLKDVCVYYKVKHTDGKYLGGITYVVNFGELKAGESLEKLAGHYDEEKAEIVRISFNVG